MPRPLSGHCENRRRGCGWRADAASVETPSLIARLYVVNRELQEAKRQLDKICMEIGETEAAPGDGVRRQDMMISSPCQVRQDQFGCGCSRRVLALLADGIIRRLGHCAGRVRSPAAAASRKSSSCVTPLMLGRARRSIMGHVLLASMTLKARAATPPYVNAVTGTAVGSVA